MATPRTAAAAAPVRLARAGGVPRAVAHVRVPPRAGGRAVLPVRPDAPAVQRVTTSAGGPPRDAPHAGSGRPARVSRPDTTRLLDKLAERKLVERNRPAANRREVRVGVTAAGVALLDALQEPLRECHARQLGHLTRAQLRDLTALLRAARMPHEGADSSWR